MNKIQIHVQVRRSKQYMGATWKFVSKLNIHILSFCLNFHLLTLVV